MSERLEDIRQRLEAISEELADLALDRLRESVEGGDEGLAQQERIISRARRAVDKAVQMLARDEDEPEFR